MRDFSFIRFKDNLQDTLKTDNSPMASVVYYDVIQLLPNESYLQLTNYNGGISLQSIFTAEIVNCRGVKLKDITNHVFTEEFLDSDGNTQIAIEIVNINQDFYNEPVLIKLYDNYVEYFSNPVTITEEFKELTTYFEYKNYNDFLGIPYTNSQKYQSIRLKCYFTNSTNESDISDYYQISSGNTISARVLYKSSEKYVFDYMDVFVYNRVNILLQHDLVYLDGVKLTNKVSFESNELIDKSNLFDAEFSVYKNYKETKNYEYQIFEGLEIVSLSPEGVNTLLSIDSDINIQFSSEIQINTGTLSLYNSSGLVHTFTQDDIELDDIEGAQIDDGILNHVTENGEYYILVSSGLFSDANFGINFEGIQNPETWTFTVVGEQYDSTQYANNEYLT